jgi:hypothetical protein
MQLKSPSISNEEVEQLLKDVAKLNLDATTVKDEHFHHAMRILERKRGEPIAAMCRRMQKRCDNILATQIGKKQARKAAQVVVAHVRNRSLITSRKANMQGDDPRLYEALTEVPGIPAKDLAGRYKDRQIMSVKRSEEPTTRALHALCRLGRDRMVATAPGNVLTPDYEQAVKQATVLSILLWRQLGGTVFLAVKIGFLTSWGPKEKKRVERMSRAIRDGVGKPLLNKLEAWDEQDHEEVLASLRTYRPQLTQKQLAGEGLTSSDFFTPGYFPPSFLHSTVHDVTAGVKNNFPAQYDFDIMMDAVLKTADNLWSKDIRYQDETVLDGILRIARENVSWRDACYCAMVLWGKAAKHPSFGTKELVQDLLDLEWIFPKGRAAVLDLGLFSPCGKGALKGLMKILDRAKNDWVWADQDEVQALLQCVYAHVLEIQQQGQGYQFIEELHDLQYNLCEIFKVLLNINLHPRRGHANNKVKLFRRVDEKHIQGGGDNLGKRRAQFAAARRDAKKSKWARRAVGVLKPHCSNCPVA